MANTVLIAAGAGAAVSADIPVAASPITIHGYAAAGVTWTAQIQIKNNDGTYTAIGGITSQSPVQTIYGPGTYRVSRPAGGGVCAIDQDT